VGISSSPSNLLWKGILPPKFNVFIWILLHGRICTKEFIIARRHLMHLEEAICPFCAEEIYRICGSSFSTLFCGLEIVEPLIWFGLTYNDVCQEARTIEELFFEWYFLVKGKIQHIATLMLAFGILRGNLVFYRGIWLVSVKE
jgi:hypothetical protein